MIVVCEIHLFLLEGHVKVITNKDTPLMSVIQIYHVPADINTARINRPRFVLE